MNTRKKRTFYSIGAIIVALALLVGGTFAYSLFEHKSNFLKKDAKAQARLVENFEDTDDWVVDTTLTKEVSVMNLGNTNQFPNPGWSNIYVRVQLKEFMEIKAINYEYYYEGYDEDAPIEGEKNYTRFMIDRSGNFVRIPVSGAADKEAAVTAFISNSSNWTNVLDDPNVATNKFLQSLSASDFVEAQGLYDNEPYYYLKTSKNSPNGQYGAGIVMKKIVSDTGIDIPGMEGVQKATDVDYTNYVSTNAWHDHTEECDYPVHVWDPDDPEFCNFGTHYYVEWNMNPDHYMYYSEWLKNPGVYEKWILDTDTGWAYWSSPIPEYNPANPTANVTSTLLDSITLVNDPGGEFFYVIHVDMEAYDIIDLPNDWLIRDAFKPSSDLSFMTSSVRGDIASETTKPSPNIRNKNADDVIEYSINNTSVATIDSSTGELTLVGVGTAVVTAEVIDGPNKGQIFTYNLEVVDNTPPPTTVPPTTVPQGPPPIIPTVKGNNNVDPYVPNVVIGENNNETAYLSDFFCADVTYFTTPPDIDISQYGQHYGYFHLEDIITEGSLADVQIDYATLATMNGNRVNNLNVYRGNDTREGKNNAESIVYRFIPDSNADLESISGDVYYFVANIPLKRVVGAVTQTATIKVKFTYGTDTTQMSTFIGL